MVDIQFVFIIDLCSFTKPHILQAGASGRHWRCLSVGRPTCQAVTETASNTSVHTAASSGTRLSRYMYGDRVSIAAAVGQYDRPSAVQTSPYHRETCSGRPDMLISQSIRTLFRVFVDKKYDVTDVRRWGSRARVITRGYSHPRRTMRHATTAHNGQVTGPGRNVFCGRP